MEQQTEYETLRGLNDQDLRLNLIHWVGKRLPKAKPSEVQLEAEALFGYVRYGLIAKSLTALPRATTETEVNKAVKEAVDKIGK